MNFFNNQEKTISCHNSNGEAIQASLLNLSRYSASFEVYNPYSIMQLSEVLQDFQIKMQGKLIYEGEAVVSGLINTGVLVVCEVSLTGTWYDVDLHKRRESGNKNLDTEFTNYLESWKEIHQLSDEFKLIVADMQSILMGIERWVNEIELSVKSLSDEKRDNEEREILATIREQFTMEFSPHMDALERIHKTIDPAHLNSYKYYIRRHLHPFILCAPFPFRTFQKPLGYAGDYEMVAMMLRDSSEGCSMFAKLVNYAFLGMDPVIAHRNRITYLHDSIREITKAKSMNNGRPRILNLGCGPAQEIQRFITQDSESDFADFTLLDFNLETLQYTSGVLSDLKTKHQRTVDVTYLERSVNQLLRQSNRGDIDMEWESFDLVYCAGLFDYLSQKVCKRLVSLFYKLIAPGGKVIVTNVSDTNPRIGGMELLLEWNLIYRDNEGMLDLIPNTMGVTHDLTADETGVNLFLEISKP
ncbi:MAG: SAM-dependent methyltransferase [Akkermansiaceae bacterium]